jgi:hypothetical protein
MPITSTEQRRRIRHPPDQGAAIKDKIRIVDPTGVITGPRVKAGRATAGLPCLHRLQYTGNRVAFVAAPYGFGPSSKAVAISSHLPDSIERDFFGAGPPLDLARASLEFANCTRLDFGAPAEEVAEVLAQYRVVVFVNTTRFLAAASRNDNSLMFVDTLAWIRGSWPCPLPPESAYFAQRFFDYGFSADLEGADSFYATSAIVPKTLTTPKDPTAIPSKSPIVHCGGLYSPAMRPGADAAFVTHLCTALNEIRLPVRAILPKHLHSRFAALAISDVSLIDCSPVDVGEHIEGSLFALTTSGIEFTYESVLLGVPTLFLPPFNATQLLQLDYHRRAHDGCVPFILGRERRPTSQTLDADTAVIQEDGMCGIWAAQFGTLGLHLKRAITGNFIEYLAALRRRQERSFAAVGSDGARKIAAHIMGEIGRS